MDLYDRGFEIADHTMGHTVSQHRGSALAAAAPTVLLTCMTIGGCPAAPAPAPCDPAALLSPCLQAHGALTKEEIAAEILPFRPAIAKCGVPERCAGAGRLAGPA